MHRTHAHVHIHARMAFVCAAPARWPAWRPGVPAALRPCWSCSTPAIDRPNCKGNPIHTSFHQPAKTRAPAHFLTSEPDGVPADAPLGQWPRRICTRSNFGVRRSGLAGGAMGPRRAARQKHGQWREPLLKQCTPRVVYSIRRSVTGSQNYLGEKNDGCLWAISDQTSHTCMNQQPIHYLREHVG